MNCSSLLLMREPDQAEEHHRHTSLPRQARRPRPAAGFGMCAQAPGLVITDAA